MAKATQSPSRQAMLAKVHIAKKDLGFDDDMYRDFLAKHTRKRSASQLNFYELQTVLNAMQKSGFKPTSKIKGRRPSVAEQRKALLSKLEAILTDMNLSWNYATSMCRKMFDVMYIDWLDNDKLYKLVQAMAVYQARQKKKDS